VRVAIQRTGGALNCNYQNDHLYQKTIETLKKPHFYGTIFL
jgi:hypothetical protein